jgi:AcrR family transcriptional regulator
MNLLHSKRVPDRSTAQGEKRRLLLDAAVRVFARKGYHASRVGDIADGLVPDLAAARA